jgi:hypothetical protein
MTTLMIDDELARQAKRLAAEQGKTLVQFVSEVLRGAVGNITASRAFRGGVPVIKLDPPTAIDPQAIQTEIGEHGF